MLRVLQLSGVALVLALIIVATPVLAAGEAHEGLVLNAGDGKLTMTDKDGKNEHTHMVADDAKITRAGKDIRLNDLKKGDAVTVTTAKKAGKEMAVKIECK